MGAMRRALDPRCWSAPWARRCLRCTPVAPMGRSNYASSAAGAAGHRLGARDAAIDLQNASVERLDNGLTVILLEDRRFPVVSVQMLYRVGARDEVTGKTGLAHFLEHMAFRDSENFPGTGSRRPHLRRGWRVARLHLDRPDDLLRNGAEGRSRPAATDRGGPHVGAPAARRRHGGGTRLGARRDAHVRERSRHAPHRRRELHRLPRASVPQ